MDMGSKPGLPFPSGATLDHRLHFSEPPFPHLPNGDHGTDFLGWIKWDNSSAFIKHSLCARGFSGQWGASGEDQVMDTMELTFYRPWKQSKKKSFQGIISPKRHYSKRMQGHNVSVCLEWALRSSSGKLGFEQRPKLSKDGSWFQVKGAASAVVERGSPHLDAGTARTGGWHGLRGWKDEWKRKKWHEAGLGGGELQSSGWGLGIRFYKTVRDM